MLVTNPRYPDHTPLPDLDLSYNPLSFISSDAFANITRMRSLLLNRTQLTSIDHIVFPSNIKLMDLTYTELDSISSIQVSTPGYSTLKELYLSNNPLSNISSEAFTNLTQVNKLEVTYTRLESIDNVLFPSSIVYLYLEKNAISSIDALQFTDNDAISLKYLYLNNNPITFIAGDVFRNITLLNRLELSSTEITSIDHIIFPSRLGYIELEAGSIANISAIRFTNEDSINVWTLSLSGNPITTCSSDVFVNMTALSTLEFKYAKLTSVDHIVFPSRLRSLRWQCMSKRCSPPAVSVE